MFIFLVILFAIIQRFSELVFLMKFSWSHVFQNWLPGALASWDRGFRIHRLQATGLRLLYYYMLILLLLLLFVLSVLLLLFIAQGYDGRHLDRAPFMGCKLTMTIVISGYNVCVFLLQGFRLNQARNFIGFRVSKLRIQTKPETLSSFRPRRALVTKSWILSHFRKSRFKPNQKPHACIRPARREARLANGDGAQKFSELVFLMKFSWSHVSNEIYYVIIYLFIRYISVYLFISYIIWLF